MKLCIILSLIFWARAFANCKSPRLLRVKDSSTGDRLVSEQIEDPNLNVRTQASSKSSQLSFGSEKVVIRPGEVFSVCPSDKKDWGKVKVVDHLSPFLGEAYVNTSWRYSQDLQDNQFKDHLVRNKDDIAFTTDKIRTLYAKPGVNHESYLEAKKNGLDVPEKIGWPGVNDELKILDSVLMPHTEDGKESLRPYYKVEFNNKVGWIYGGYVRLRSKENVKKEKLKEEQDIARLDEQDVKESYQKPCDEEVSTQGGKTNDFTSDVVEAVTESELDLASSEEKFNEKKKYKCDLTRCYQDQGLKKKFKCAKDEKPLNDQKRRDQYDYIIKEMAEKYKGVSPALIKAQIQTESGFIRTRENKHEKCNYKRQIGIVKNCSHNANTSKSVLWGRGLGQFGANNAHAYGLAWYKSEEEIYQLNPDLKNDPKLLEKYKHDRKLYLPGDRNREGEKLASIFDPEASVEAMFRLYHENLRGVDHLSLVDDVEKDRLLAMAYVRGLARLKKAAKLYEEVNKRKPSVYRDIQFLSPIKAQCIGRCAVAKIVGVCGDAGGLYKHFIEDFK